MISNGPGTPRGIAKTPETHEARREVRVVLCVDELIVAYGSMRRPGNSTICTGHRDGPVTPVRCTGRPRRQDVPLRSIDRVGKLVTSGEKDVLYY